MKFRNKYSHNCIKLTTHNSQLIYHSFMEHLQLEATPTSAYVDFNPTTGKIEMKGRSVPENPLEFFNPLTSWLETYHKEVAQPLSFDVKLEYFNTSSSKCLLDVFKKILLMHRAGIQTEITWWCEEFDDDMVEAGEDYKEMLNMPFNIKILEE